MPPNQPATPVFSFRFPPDLREAAERIADERGQTMTEFIIGAIAREIRAWPGHSDA